MKIELAPFEAEIIPEAGKLLATQHLRNHNCLGETNPGLFIQEHDHLELGDGYIIDKSIQSTGSGRDRHYPQHVPGIRAHCFVHMRKHFYPIV